MTEQCCETCRWADDWRESLFIGRSKEGSCVWARDNMPQPHSGFNNVLYIHPEYGKKCKKWVPRDDQANTNPP